MDAIDFESTQSRRIRRLLGDFSSIWPQPSTDVSWESTNARIYTLQRRYKFESSTIHTMEIARFRNVFQVIPECRKTLLCCLTGGELIALRRAIGFWLSKNEKRTYLNLVWDIFHNLDWVQSATQVTMMGRSLDGCQVEACLKEQTLTPHATMVPFIIMIRAPVCYDSLAPWTKWIQSAMERCTPMNVVDGPKKRNRWDAIASFTLEGSAAGMDISIPITLLSEDTLKQQLGTATTSSTTAMSIFQPKLEEVKRITIARLRPSGIRYATAPVITYKTVDAFIVVTGGPPHLTCVSLIIKAHPDGAGWPQGSQVFMRVVDKEQARLTEDKDGRPGWMVWHCPRRS